LNDGKTCFVGAGETNAFLLMRFQEPGESQIFGIAEMPIPERFSPTFDF
jgi:hypothetical protein